MSHPAAAPTSRIPMPRIPVPRILIQPRDGVEPVVALIAGATGAINLKMFAFTSRVLLDALAAAASRGVAVRVMLNPARSSGDRANDETMAALAAAGVATAWTSPDFAVTHEKSMTVDGRTALIATFNFSDKYFSLTRDYGLVTEDVGIVREVEEGFQADWLRRPLPLKDDSTLLWSNRNARPGMAELIDTARRSIHVQHPKFSDVAILDRLLDAHGRGVRLRILCGGRHGISPSDMLDTFGALRILARAGVPIRRQQGLRLHAKLMIVDGARALLGSMNIDRSAFDLRRELGAVISETHALGALGDQFDADWKAGHAYAPPDPLATVPDGEAAHFSDLDHE